MKTIKYNIILLAIVMFFTSCYKDDSNKNISVINPIVIDNSVQEMSITVYQMDSVHISPTIYKNGTEDAELRYEWKLSGPGIVPMVLGNSMTLHEVVPVPAEAYTLTLTVTDAVTTIQNFATYYLTVQPQFGNGLLVSDTRDGGATSDLSLIRAQNFSGDYRVYDIKKNRTFRDIYSSVNNNKFNGKITGVYPSDEYAQFKLITICSDSKIERINPGDFTIKDRDNELFYLPIEQDKFKPMGMGFIHSYAPSEIANINGTLYSRKIRFANYFGYKMLTSNSSDYNITKISQSWLSYENPYLWDDLNNRFLQIGDDNATIKVFANQYQTSVFDINNLKGYAPIYLGRGQIDGSYRAMHNIVKTVSDNKYYCLTFVIDDATGEPKPYSKYDLNGCEKVNEAVAFECNPSEDVLYYATKDGIYSSLFSKTTTALSSKKVYTPSDGEEITDLKLWRAYGFNQGKVRIKDENQNEGFSLINALNRMLVISTYNKTTKEGKIITIPIPNLGAGELETDRNFHFEYGGFGEISYYIHQSF